MTYSQNLAMLILICRKAQIIYIFFKSLQSWIWFAARYLYTKLHSANSFCILVTHQYLQYRWYKKCVDSQGQVFYPGKGQHPPGTWKGSSNMTRIAVSTYEQFLPKEANHSWFRNKIILALNQILSLPS